VTTEQYERIRRDVEACAPVPLVKPSDLLFLPPALQVILHRAFRDGRITAVELAAGLTLELAEAQALAGLLVQKGFLLAGAPEDGAVYLARFGGRTARPGQSPLDRL
jgi:hypothetical protein